MTCCNEPAIASVNAKCSDLCFIEFPDGSDSDGYVPSNLNIGHGDYIRFNFCMNCGKISGKFPVSIPNRECGPMDNCEEDE